MDKLISKDLCPLDSKEMNILKNITNKLSNIQISWLSGYFWGLANNDINNNFVKNKVINSNSLTIIYASQTGNAKEISKKLYKKCISCNISAKLYDANEYKFKKIAKEKLIVIIISTHGEGEIPDSACSFYDFLLSKRAPKLVNLYYSIFALGDKSYEFFCQAGKNFDKILYKLGGKSLLSRVDADIEYNLEFKKWVKFLLEKICNKYKSFLKNIKIKDNSSFITKKKKNKIKYNKNNPFSSYIILNQKITGNSSNKDVRHIEIDLMNSNIKYKPGDALGIWYKNDVNLIIQILKLLNIKKDYIINYNGLNITIFNALKKYYELTVNTFSLVKKYFKYINNNYALNVLKLNIIKLRMYSKYVPIIDMINYFPLQIKGKDFINILRPLQPRLYSISSSQLEVENEVHITVSIIKYMYNNNFRFGGASFYLSNLLPDKNKLKIYIASNKNFRLPKDNNIPIIMICAGTGIAPFRAFMQDRFFNKAKGKNWLFFGNQIFTEDFLYQLEWQKYYSSGFLTRIDLSFSRDQHTKEKYIQEKLILHGLDVWNWIKDGSYIYICGNIKTIAKSVEIALLKIFIKYGNMNITSAIKYLNKLRNLKRYQRDVY